MISSRSLLSYIARGVLLASLIAVATLGLAPIHEPKLTVDKAEHAGWFFWLTVVAAAAFPKVRLRWISLVLIAAGIFAEFLQARLAPLRGVGLDDVIADTVGVAFAFAACAVGKYRTRFRGL